MKLQDYRETFYAFSGKASDLSRQLSFAGIALIWLFKKEDGGQPSIPHDLIFPGILIVASLATEIAHYCIASIIWWCFYRSKERAGVSEDAEIDHSSALEFPINLLFVVKIGCVIVAYLLIFAYLIRTLLTAHTGA